MRKPKKLSQNLRWKAGTTIAAVIMLGVLYSKGIIAVATVNDQPVSLREFISILKREDPDQVIDTAIARKLIEIEAQKRSIIVTAEEKQAEIERLTNLASRNGQTVYELMKTAENDKKALEKNVELRITIYKLFDHNVEFTEDQIEDYLDQNDNSYTREERRELEESLEYLLLNEKVSSEYRSWIRDAKASAEVNYIVNF